jgi:hypothetical protein
MPLTRTEPVPVGGARILAVVALHGTSGLRRWGCNSALIGT